MHAMQPQAMHRDHVVLHDAGSGSDRDVALGMMRMMPSEHARERVSASCSNG